MYVFRNQNAPFLICRFFLRNIFNVAPNDKQNFVLYGTEMLFLRLGRSKSIHKRADPILQKNNSFECPKFVRS